MKSTTFPFQPFSDTIAGYVASPLDSKKHQFTLQLLDGKKMQVNSTDTTYIEVMRNLDEPFQQANLEQSIVPDRFLFAYGIFYPEKGGIIFEAKHLILVGKAVGEYRFEEPDWWIKQIRALASFYFHAQFADGVIDYTRYRTHLTLEGQKIHNPRQETDTLSRMIYGFATTYLLTGEERYLEAAEKGTEYLRDHMRAIDESENIVYWYHAMDVSSDGRERKILSSQFGDDYEAIPAYEQIYALCGPVQTYRVTGDPRILRDAEMTINLFNRFFLDSESGGYFSHIDPITFSPRSDSLGADRARKNWNSIGDHAPAYLINLWLATGEPSYAEMLVTLAGLVEEHFPDEQSPFVQERYYGDWTPDTTWGWQQNRAVVGHNLKIAWNLMRIHHLRPNQRHTNLAKKLASEMPHYGIDSQRGGWYDMMERLKGPGQEWHRFVWHDRKAWWQQEQAILAYLILAGSLRDEQYRRLARESAAFYNAFFLDHDNGGVYFNVCQNGIPYLLGTERLKGSHSMSGYHSFELCYLAAVYTNLLITRQPMDFYFKPQPGALKENILRVQPDLLPPGSAQLTSVWINDQAYYDFDPVAMTIKLPTGEEVLKVHVRIEPTGGLFDSQLEIIDEVAHLTLYGTLNEVAAPIFRSHLEQIMAAQPQHVVLHLADLQAIASGSARALGFVVEKLALDKEVYVEGANAEVQASLQKVGVWEELNTDPLYANPVKR